MSTTEYIQIIIGIGQIIAVAIIPIIVWVLGIKYQDRKAKKRCSIKSFPYTNGRSKISPNNKRMG